jgi:hypothetical protein
LHLAQTGKRGLQNAISGRLGDPGVEGKREAVELVGLINYQLGLINKLFQPIPFFGRRPGRGERRNRRLDGILGIEHLSRIDVQDVVGNREPIGGICQLVNPPRLGRQRPITTCPVDEWFAGTTASRRNASDENFMITTWQDVLQSAVEPAEAASNDRGAGLLDRARHSREAATLRLPARGGKKPSYLLLIAGEHADRKRRDGADVIQQRAGSIDGDGDQQRIQRQRGKRRHRYPVRAFSGGGGHYGHAGSEASSSLSEFLARVFDHQCLTSGSRKRSRN